MKITYEELMSEVDKYKVPLKNTDLTDEQKEFIIKCRTGDKVVPFQKMADLWEMAGWGSSTEASMRRYLKKVLA